MDQKIAVFGTVFVDFKGFSQEKYDPFGRNLGSIDFIYGGVGRNVAHNLAQIGVPTQFISTISDSVFGKAIAEELQQNNIDISKLKAVGDDGMGMWLAILGPSGELEGSISQMPNLSYIEQLIQTEGEQLISSCTHVVLEIDLNETISQEIVRLANELGKPVFGIPGNLEVILGQPDILSSLSCFICNDIEADKLMGRPISTMKIEEMQQQLFDYAQSRHISSMIITLGERGSIYYDSNTQECGYVPVNHVALIDSTGAGDAFFSGTVAGLIRGLTLQESVKCGTKIAGWTVESKESTRRDLAKLAKEDAELQILFRS